MAITAVSKTAFLSSNLSIPAPLLSNHMSSENQSNDLKLKALSTLQAIFDEGIPYGARTAGKIIAEQFGISSDEARDLVIEFVDARQKNELPGEIITLPEPRKLKEKERLTKLEVHAGNFTLAYVEEVLGLEQQYPLGLQYWGQWWLGNSDVDTKTLVGWMHQNPQKVADYLEWTLNPRQPEKDSLVEDFRTRVHEGKLKKPQFE